MVEKLDRLLPCLPTATNPTIKPSLVSPFLVPQTQTQPLPCFHPSPTSQSDRSDHHLQISFTLDSFPVVAPSLPATMTTDDLDAMSRRFCCCSSSCLYLIIILVFISEQDQFVNFNARASCCRWVSHGGFFSSPPAPSFRVSWSTSTSTRKTT
ncbi:hypothetical protein NE237_019724 [Protea cynaroides]|uniref:Uncharacterized protein n=1 Tax=Protea cynaroides TaxID=273540 RepID=A0A9Q0H9U0_9MAGN|nr:hypothetical protein NE237_019724 [Protea cynaroides]